MPRVAPIDRAVLNPLARAISSSTRIPRSSVSSVPVDADRVVGICFFLSTVNSRRSTIGSMVDPTSVDGDDLSGHERAVVRGEVDERTGQVVGVPAPRDRLALGRERGELALVEVELDLLLGAD